MSEITRSETSHSVYGGIIIDVAEEGLEHVQKTLAGIRGGWQQAVGSALSRAASSGKTMAKKSATNEYTISQGTFLGNTKNINHFKNYGGGVEIVFGFRGYVIPLLKFNTSVNKGGYVTTQVKRSGAKEALEHAFKANMGSHTGIFERIGLERFPVKELFGPSTPQMMYSNEKSLDDTEKKMVDTYEKRIDHEIMRLLNGWGG